MLLADLPTEAVVSFFPRLAYPCHGAIRAARRQIVREVRRFITSDDINWGPRAMRRDKAFALTRNGGRLR